MSQLPQRDSFDTREEHLADHNELHRLHNILEDAGSEGLVSALAAKETPAGAQAKADTAYSAAIQRGHHTGTQLASTIIDLAEFVQALSPRLKGFVNHGAVASTARPSGYISVEWYGSVVPIHAEVGDTWVDTTT